MARDATHHFEVYGKHDDRKIDAFNHKSYENDKYQAWFFAVEGSPIKLCGFAVTDYNVEGIWYFTSKIAINMKKHTYFKNKLIKGHKTPDQINSIYLKNLRSCKKSK